MCHFKPLFRELFQLAFKGMIFPQLKVILLLANRSLLESLNLPTFITTQAKNVQQILSFHSPPALIDFYLGSKGWLNTGHA